MDYDAFIVGGSFGSDLPERIRWGAKLRCGDMSSFWCDGPAGYDDYPTPEDWRQIMGRGHAR